MWVACHVVRSLPAFMDFFQSLSAPSLSSPHSKFPDVSSFSAGELVPKCSLQRPECRIVPAVDPVESGFLIHFWRTHSQMLFSLYLLPYTSYTSGAVNPLLVH